MRRVLGDVAPFRVRDALVMMTRTASQRGSSITFVSFGLIAVSVLLTATAAGLRLASSDRHSASSALTVVLIATIGVLAFSAALLWFLRLGALRRVAALEKRFPDALVASAMVTQDFGFFARAADSPATMNGLPVGNAYVAIVVNRTSIRIFRGSRHPRLKATIPSTAVQRFEAGTWMAGPVRTVPAVLINVITQSGSTVRLPVQLLPWSHTFFPRFGKPQQVSDFCDRAAEELGLPA